MMRRDVQRFGEMMDHTHVKGVGRRHGWAVTLGCPVGRRAASHPSPDMSKAPSCHPLGRLAPLSTLSRASSRTTHRGDQAVT